MKKGYIYLGAVITISLIAVMLAAMAYVFLGSQGPNQNIFAGCTLEAKLCPDGSAVGRSGPNCEFMPCPAADIEATERAVINNFIAQWSKLQQSIPMQPVLGSTSWNVDDLQFIGDNTILVAFEDGHIMGVAVYQYDSVHTFTYLALYKDEYPFSQDSWQQVVTQYGNADYQVATYTKEIVRGTDVARFDDWTSVPENKFMNVEGVLVNWCSQDSDCKLIYSSCGCEAVLNSDPRTYLEADEICKLNECTTPVQKSAACANNKCQ